MKPRIKAVLAAVLLTPLSLWLLAYGWPQQHLYYQNYRFDAAEARRLAPYSKAMLAYGDQAWRNLAPNQAAGFYRQAVRRDVLNMDGWLKLAQAEAARGREEQSRAILSFVAATAGHISRWQSSIALLAHELGMENVFRQSINFLLIRKLNIDTALTLLDVHYGNAEQSLAVLETSNYPLYLDGLIRRGRLADARLAWNQLSEHQTPNESMLLKYIDFLILNKIIDEAQAIWHEYTGTIGVTNGGFEQQPSGKGFDWRAYPSPDNYWKIRRTMAEGHGHTAGLEIAFFGQANVDFHHLYQIVPLMPGRKHRLTFKWRGARLTTDQGPFIELAGYDCDELYLRSPMLLGSSDWRKMQIDFIAPPDCGAVRLRLRRKISSRFDNRIAGTLWLDDFQIEPTDGA
jgi:hypothetical protein